MEDETGMRRGGQGHRDDMEMVCKGADKGIVAETDKQGWHWSILLHGSVKMGGWSK